MALALILLAFVIFVAATTWQIRLAYQVREALIARHPTVWRTLTEASLLGSPVSRFTRRRMDAGLNDPALSRLASRHRLAWYAALSSWLLMIAGLVLGYVANPH